LLELDGVPVPRWQEIQERCGRAVEAQATLTVLALAPGAEEPATWTLAAAPAQARDLGFDLAPPDGVYRTEGLAAALLEGVRASGRFLLHTGLTLKRMATQEVSTKNLGGIITISRVSYRVSSMGWTKLLFFLCILSVNLAFLNVLPIPVLDGGHLFFLLVERLKGSPVSARTLGYSQMVGMVLIVTLMVYVTYNDLLRWIGS
ncbi:MAG: site-2 protease family protein, partial [Planctomycetota bacterium]|nr:site-2 protease family protein [Planctomycetota bacterium]